MGSNPATSTQTPETTVNKITAYKDWCDIDRLDGLDLENGELLHVEFPDRTLVSVITTVKKWHVGGGPGEARLPYSKASIPVEYHGVAIDLPLAGLKAKRA